MPPFVTCMKYVVWAMVWLVFSSKNRSCIKSAGFLSPMGGEDIWCAEKPSAIAFCAGPAKSRAARMTAAKQRRQPFTVVRQDRRRKYLTLGECETITDKKYRSNFQ